MQFSTPVGGGSSYSQALKFSIEQYNGLFITSAGNNGTNNDEIPIYSASYNSNNIISVAAIDPYNLLTRFPNFGFENVDIAAPGSNIISLDLIGKTKAHWKVDTFYVNRGQKRCLAPQAHRKRLVATANRREGFYN